MMKNPSHPGDILKRRILPAAGLTVTEAAKRLQVTRQTLNNVVNRKSGVSPEMAIRLSRAFGSTPEVWLGMQMAYDLAQLRSRGFAPDIPPVAAVRSVET
jgi:addiction module HigA family antidote